MVKKIDFHIHTVPSIKDSEFTYSSKWLIKYVNEANLDAIAITNHDLFDKDNYLQVKKDMLKARNGEPVVVFPGMELALEKFHVNIVFPDSMVDELTDFSSWLQEKHVDQNSSITIDELFTNLKNWNQGIYIFELGKSKGIDEIPIELQEVTAVGGVRNQFQFQIIKNEEDSLTPVLFSDAHATKIDSDPDRNDLLTKRPDWKQLLTDKVFYPYLTRFLSLHPRPVPNCWQTQDGALEKHVLSEKLQTQWDKMPFLSQNFYTKHAQCLDDDDWGGPGSLLPHLGHLHKPLIGQQVHLFHNKGKRRAYRDQN